MRSKKETVEALEKESMRKMFNGIATRYDLLNRVLSFGVDQRWRRIMLKSLKKNVEAQQGGPYTILDLATGTGDVAIGIRKTIQNSVVTGADLSEEMMRVGEEKVKRMELDGVSFTQANASELPFSTDSFNAVTIAFGIRNFRELDTAFQEIHRVMKPGATLHVLEFAWPKNLVVSLFYRLYSNIFIPVVGKLLAGDKAAYSYLTGSIRSFPNGDEITGRMAAAGMTHCSYKPLGAGIVHLYIAYK